MKLNNKTLGLIFFVLLGLFIARKTVFKPKVRSFSTSINNFTADEVDKITIALPGDKLTTLLLNGDSWSVLDGERNFAAEQSAVENVLSEFANIKTKQLVSRDQAKWAEYEVDEENAKVYKFYSGSKRLAGVNVGRFNFNQQTKSGFSYARSVDEDDIYSIDGFLSLSADKKFNSFRNSQLFKLDPAILETIKLTLGDNEYTLSKSLDGAWVKDGTELDSSGVTSYLNKLSSLNGVEFVDDFVSDGKMKIASLTIGDNSLEVYENTGDGFIIKSSGNEAYFRSDTTGIYKSLFSDFIDL